MEEPQSLRDRIGHLLRDDRLAIITELAAMTLVVVLWELTPVPRTIIPLFLWGWLSLWLRRQGWRDVGLRRPASWGWTILLGVTRATSKAPAR